MSDFLSNFSGDQYKKIQEEKARQKEEKSTQNNTSKKEEGLEKESSELKKNQDFTESIPQEKTKESSFEETFTKEDGLEKPKKPQELKAKTNTDDYIELDSTYKQRQQKKYVLIGLGSLLIFVFLSFLYYQLTHVFVPNFSGKELTEVRQWTAENGVKLQVEQKYNFENEVNHIISQTVKNKKIRKGNTLIVDASLGPDPEEHIILPDFKTMKLTESQSWKEQEKAENIAIIEEYNDTVAKGDYIKFEITNKEVVAEKYKRKDKAKLYYSKGKEVYEKNISVLDFSGKTKEEATAWAKKNEIDLKIEERDSDTIETDKIISQSIEKETKIAKKDSMTIIVSSGKAVIVPDFSQFTVEEAETKGGSLEIKVKQVFNETIPYGGFISQSIPSGTKYQEKNEKPPISVTYSAGKPYLKDLRGTTLEGDLQKIFYEEYQSKGAAISYSIYYIDSSETKGTVVAMSKYNEFVPINSVIQIGISRGNLISEENMTNRKNTNNENSEY